LLDFSLIKAGQEKILKPFKSSIVTVNCLTQDSYEVYMFMTFCDARPSSSRVMPLFKILIQTHCLISCDKAPGLGHSW